MLVVWFVRGAERGRRVDRRHAAEHGGVRRDDLVRDAGPVLHPACARTCRTSRGPYRSPLGVPGAVVTIVIALVTIYYQLQDPVYRNGVYGAAIWYVLGLLYFAFVGRHRLVLSPEEEFALTRGEHGHPEKEGYGTTKL